MPPLLSGAEVGVIAVIGEIIAGGGVSLVLGFPLLLGSPLLLLTLLAPLALAAPVRPLSIRVAAVPFALLPTAPRGPRLRGLLSTIVLQLALLQLAILPFVRAVLNVERRRPGEAAAPALRREAEGTEGDRKIPRGGGKSRAL